MKQTARSFKSDLILWVVLLVPVLWFAVILAQCAAPGANLAILVEALTAAMNEPLNLRWTERTAAYLLAAVLLYAVCITFYYSTRGNTRPGEEHGSARWGNVKQINAKYRAKEPENNIILTQNLRIGLDPKRHRRNLHAVIVGGSGAGKTRFFCKPNGMQCGNTSYFFCDPKGEMLYSLGPLLQSEGYEIKVFDLINPELSDCFNPLRYVRSDTDVLKLVANLIKSTTPKNAQQNDPFWEKAETALVSALLLYLYHTAPDYEQNFNTVMFMIENAAIDEEGPDITPIDILFDALAEDDPEHIAVKQYRVFKQASGKTATSILVSAAVRLSAFSIPEIARITSRDQMDFDTLGEKKQAVFAIIPDNDDSLNFLIGMMYTSLFQELYHVADNKYHGALPRHVRVIQDEWANVAMPNDYLKILATARSRNIGIYIVVQGISMIKAAFKDDWEALIGLVDTMLYLGSNEQFSHKYLSEQLGKSTIDTKTRGITRGKSGSSSENFQQTGRSLLTPDEIRLLDNDYALVLIRGELPVMDRKYDIMKHSNVSRTEDGGAAPYIRSPHYERPDLSAPFTSLDDYEF